MTKMEKRIHDDLDHMNIDIFECHLKANKSIAFEEGYVGVDFKGLSCAEQNDVLAHDSGHFMSGAFYHAFSPLEIKTRVEARAKRASIKRYLAYDDLNEAICDGICTLWELAEHFDFTESFIKTALEYYTNTRGWRFGDADAQLTLY